MVVRYSGHTVDLHFDYPPILQSIQSAVEKKLGEKFNLVMLNQYQDGKEYIGKHRDTKENRVSHHHAIFIEECRLYRNKVIASLSLGAERAFIFTPGKKVAEQGASMQRFRLAGGSLLVMQGDTQRNWTVRSQLIS